MYEFWYDYIKPKYQYNAKLFYMDRDSFIIDNKTEDVNKNIPDDVEKRSDTSNYAIERPLPIDELGGKIMTEFVGLRPKKAYSYLINDGNSDKKAKTTKNV